MPLNAGSETRPADAVSELSNSGAASAEALAARIHGLEAELRELQHRAKNSLQLVISLLKLQAGRIRDPDARAAYEHTLLRIEALAILYRQLHETGSGTHVDLGHYIEAVSQAVKANVANGAHRIAIDVDAEPIAIGLYEAMPLGLIATELLTNSLGHAYPPDGWIRVILTLTGDGRGRLSIEDNGRPLPAGFDNAAEDAMMLVDALAAQLGDSLTTETDAGGTTASLTFPV